MRVTGSSIVISWPVMSVRVTDSASADMLSSIASASSRAKKRLDFIGVSLLK